MGEIIEQFGGIKDVLLFLILFGILFFINSFIKNKIIRIPLSILSSVYIIAQGTSLYFTQSFIGYRFYVHTNMRGVVGMEGLFITQIIIASCAFIVLFFIYYTSPKIFKNLTLNKLNSFQIKVVSLISLNLLFISLGSKGYVIHDTKTLLPLLKTNNSNDFKSTLAKYGMSDYVSPNELKASSSGKNIIIISMESLEKGYLNGEFKSVTPNLNKLKNQWTYIDLEENPGSNWTSGSLYTLLTGFPGFFGTFHNGIFKDVYYSHITSISHVFQKLNYKTLFLNGNTDFSGVKEMLSTLEFDKIIDYKNSQKTGHESFYGLRDKDLFKIAKSQIDNYEKSNDNFALFISTTDTHFPAGIYDERMEGVISPQKTQLEFCVASLDYLIGDLISYLEYKNLLENTSIYLFPDHLKMGDPSVFKNSGKRGLFCITNSNTLKIDSTKLYQIDLPKIILNGANINHNLKFFTDYIKGDKIEYINNNILGITEINTSGIVNPYKKAFKSDNVSKNYYTYRKDTLRYIAHAGGTINGNIYTNSLEALNLSYSKGFRLFELDIIKTKDNHFVAAHDWKKWAMMTEYKGKLPVTKEEFLSRKIYNEYTPMDIDSINKWFKDHHDAILVTDKVNNPIEFSNIFIDKSRLMMELFNESSLRDGLKCGILSAMPSRNIVRGLSISDIKKLAQDGVKHVAISRHFIKNNKPILQVFKDNNIKAYAFHINDRGIDEEFVVKYEMDYIYGIYADNWSF